MKDPKIMTDKELDRAIKSRQSWIERELMRTQEKHLLHREIVARRLKKEKSD